MQRRGNHFSFRPSIFKWATATSEFLSKPVCVCVCMQQRSSGLTDKSTYTERSQDVPSFSCIFLTSFSQRTSPLSFLFFPPPCVVLPLILLCKTEFFSLNPRGKSFRVQAGDSEGAKWDVWRVIGSKAKKKNKEEIDMEHVRISNWKCLPRFPLLPLRTQLLFCILSAQRGGGGRKRHFNLSAIGRWPWYTDVSSFTSLLHPPRCSNCIIRHLYIFSDIRRASAPCLPLPLQPGVRLPASSSPWTHLVSNLNLSFLTTRTRVRRLWNFVKVLLPSEFALPQILEEDCSSEHPLFNPQLLLLNPISSSDMSHCNLEFLKRGPVAMITHCVLTVWPVGAHMWKNEAIGGASDSQKAVLTAVPHASERTQKWVWWVLGSVGGCLVLYSLLSPSEACSFTPTALSSHPGHLFLSSQPSRRKQGFPNSHTGEWRSESMSAVSSHISECPVTALTFIYLPRRCFFTAKLPSSFLLLLLLPPGMFSFSWQDPLVAARITTLASQEETTETFLAALVVRSQGLFTAPLPSEFNDGSFDPWPDFSAPWGSRTHFEHIICCTWSWL